MRAVLLSTCLTLIATPSFAADRWHVQATLLHDDTVFARPALVVRSGEAGVVEVSGEDGYRLELAVTEAPDGAVRITTALQSIHGDAAPVLVVMPGKPADVRIGPLGIGIVIVPDAPAG